jgi:hypothetical protein
MDKKVIKIFDQAFAHESYCGSKIGGNESKYITWDRSHVINEGDVVFFTDSSLNLVENIKVNCKKIAWLIEPPSVYIQSYNYIKSNFDKFNLILSHQESLIGISDKVKMCPMWCSWVSTDKHKIETKTKKLSIIASNKKDTQGQRLRHDIINTIRNKTEIDLYGGLTSCGIGYNPIKNKSEGLSPYMFSIIIENEKSPYFFTEKIIDSLITGTVPIYWGADKIGNFFNTEGFIFINNLEDMISILPELTEKKYNSLLPHIKENFETAIKYTTVEDYIYEKFIK